MPNELTFAGDTGLTLTATLTQGAVAIGSAIAMTESGTVSGLYLASLAGGTAAGVYAVVIKQGAVVEGSGLLEWDGAAEVRLASIAGRVWDEVLSVSAHNAANTAGRRVRDISGGVVTVGTAQAGGVASITLAAAASSVNGTYDPALVLITAGTGLGQARLVTQYDGATRVASVDRDWRVAPDATSEYQIVASANLMSTNEGLAQAGGANTITLNANASAVDNTYTGQTVVLRTGTGQDQSRIIVSYVGATKVATMATPWETQPVAGTGYVMLPLGRARVTSMEPGVLTAAAIAADAITANGLAADAAAEIATGVWANGTRVLTSGANIALAKGVGLTGLNDPTVALVAGGVWDELLSGHAVAGSAGAKLSATGAGGGGLDAAGVRAAVGLAAANLDTQIGAVQSKTNNLPAAPAAVGDIPTAATVATAVWAAVSRTLTSTALTAADVWAYVTRTTTSTQAPTAAANAAAVRAEIAPELARLDVTVGSRNSIAPDNAVIAQIQAKTTNLPADPASQAAVLGALGTTSGALAAAVLGATAGAGTVSDAMARINLQPAGVPVQLVPAAPVDTALCRVYGYFSTPDGQPAAGVKIEFKFISPGFTRSARIVAGRTVVATTSKLGELASDAGPFLDLLRTDLLTTPGVTYQVSSAELGLKNKVITLTTATADLRAILAL